MEFKNPGYSDEEFEEFEKLCGEIEEQRQKMEQYLTMVFGKRWSNIAIN